METWLQETLPEASLSLMFSIERAHKVPACSPSPGAPPRPLLARQLNSRDGDAILQAARCKGHIMYNNSNITIFPVFSAALQKVRATFTSMKKRLRNLNIHNSMFFPARLRVVYDDKTTCRSWCLAEYPLTIALALISADLCHGLGLYLSINRHLQTIMMVP